MRPRRILDGQPAVQEFVRLEILRLWICERVIVFGKEAGSSKDKAGEAGFLMHLAAEIFSGKFRDPVNVTRRKRRMLFVQPDRLIAFLCPDRLGDHQ